MRTEALGLHVDLEMREFSIVAKQKDGLVRFTDGMLWSFPTEEHAEDAVDFFLARGECVSVERNGSMPVDGPAMTKEWRARRTAQRKRALKRIQNPARQEAEDEYRRLAYTDFENMRSDNSKGEL